MLWKYEKSLALVNNIKLMFNILNEISNLIITIGVELSVECFVIFMIRHEGPIILNVTFSSLY